MQCAACRSILEYKNLRASDHTSEVSLGWFVCRSVVTDEPATSPGAPFKKKMSLPTSPCGGRAGGRSVSAGQIDALYVDKDGLHYLFDFKRVAKHHKLCPKDKGFAVRGEAPPVGVGPMAHLPDTHFQKYSLQTSIYNLMLQNTHGIDVGDRMYLLRMHADRSEFERVQCRDLRAEARKALESEAVRLAARPPPAAPRATAAAPMDTSPAEGQPGSSGEVHRPRGNAPKGKVWSNGGWVDAVAAPTAPGPSPATAGNARGRPPKRRAGCCKRKATATVVGDENAPAAQQQPDPRRGPSCPVPRAKRARTGRTSQM